MGQKNRRFIWDRVATKFPHQRRTAFPITIRGETMTIFEPDNSAFATATKDGKSIRVMRSEVFRQFDSRLLALGEIEKGAGTKEVICAVFDLQRFTKFCSQPDPHLTVPNFLNRFLAWMFRSLRDQATHEVLPEGVWLWHSLPFFAKFMGDGLLILWDTASMDPQEQRAVIFTAELICENYVKDLLPEMRQLVNDPPGLLRCGLAKGNVCSVGAGRDYVGPCINLAARLQKLPGTRFVFAKRGLEYGREVVLDDEILFDRLLKRIAVRGLAIGELVYVLAADFELMSPEEKEQFHDP